MERGWICELCGIGEVENVDSNLMDQGAITSNSASSPRWSESMASNALIIRSSDIRQREFGLLVKLKATGRLVVRCRANVFPDGRTSCSGKYQSKC